MAIAQQSAGTLFNALTAGSKIIGQIITDNDIRVDGTVEGNITSEGKVVIGEKGLVHGDVKCQNAEIMGKVEGTLMVSDTLALRATGHIEGELHTRTLIVEPNARFNGACHMSDRTEDSKAAAPKK